MDDIERLKREAEAQKQRLLQLSVEYTLMGKECEREKMYEAAIANYKKALDLFIPSIGVLLASIVGLLNTTLLYIATIPGATIEGLHPSVMLTVSIYGVIFAAYYLLGLTIPKTE